MDQNRPESRTTLIYEDPEIQVFFHPGNTDFILITFGDLISLADGKRFFADPPVYKAGMACIGIVAKRGNWFPAFSIQLACAAILPIVQNYRRRITYGGSMGGYAAIKFSGMFGTTEIISLCPQYSIDPQECDDKFNSWKDYFEPSMTGMAIRRQDISGNLFLFFDRLDPVDRYHASKIMAQCEWTKDINVPLVGHHVTSVFAGTTNLLDLIQHVMNNDVLSLIRFARKQRVGFHLRQAALLSYAQRKFPKTFWRRYLINFLKTQKLQDGFGWDFHLNVVENAIAHQEVDVASIYLEALIKTLSAPIQQASLALYLSKIRKTEISIRTYHDTNLYYDLTRGIMIHHAATDAPHLFNVCIDIAGRFANLYIQAHGTRLYLSPNHETSLTADYPASMERTPIFEIHPTVAGQFAISKAGKYLCAETDGRVACNRPGAQLWESFRFVVGGEEWVLGA